MDRGQERASPTTDSSGSASTRRCVKQGDVLRAHQLVGCAASAVRDRTEAGCQADGAAGRRGRAGGRGGHRRAQGLARLPRLVFSSSPRSIRCPSAASSPRCLLPVRLHHRRRGVQADCGAAAQLQPAHGGGGHQRPACARAVRLFSQQILSHRPASSSSTCRALTCTLERAWRDLQALRSQRRRQREARKVRDGGGRGRRVCSRPRAKPSAQPSGRCSSSAWEPSTDAAHGRRPCMAGRWTRSWPRFRRSVADDGWNGSERPAHQRLCGGRARLRHRPRGADGQARGAAKLRLPARR